MLTDNQVKNLIIKGSISIDPYNEKNIKAGKYDIHLGRYLLKPKETEKIIDPTDPNSTPEYEKIDIDKEGYILEPNEFILGQTQELIGLNSNIGMFLDGSTTMARLGVTIHQSANYIPPGQDPHIITLEIYNASLWKIKLSNKLRIGKLIAFEYTEGNHINAKDYNRYNAQKETTGAIISTNNEN